MDDKEKTLKLWEYLAETGVSKLKAYDVLGFVIDYNYCPLCQYASDHSDSDNEWNQLDCIYCPMYNKWDNEDGTKSRTCTGDKTYYMQWKDAEFNKGYYKDARKKYAKLLYINFKRDLK